jgi:hypothetical protein
VAGETGLLDAEIAALVGGSRGRLAVGATTWVPANNFAARVARRLVCDMWRERERESSNN